MKRIFLIFIVSMFFSSMLLAQTGKELLEFYSNFESSKNIEQGANRYIDIQGSPYSSNEFVKGKVIMKNGVFYKNVPLRYNIYNKEMEFEKNKVAYSISNSEDIVSVEFGNSKYVYTLFETKTNEKNTFFLLLEDGKAKLLEMQKVELIPKQEPGAYSTASPARFHREASVFYVKIDDNPAVVVKRKKDLLKAFSIHQKEMTDFINKNKISVRKIEDLKKVIVHYNTL